ncbi:MAG: carboxypeptidase regulatory-like domain-containing protein [PVC group bacterium]
MAFIFGITLFLSPVCSRGENLLENPGFEEGLTAPDGWTTFPPAPAGVTYEWDSIVCYGGERSVFIESTGSGFGIWQQVVPVTAGTVFELSGYLNVNNIPSTGSCNLELVFRDGGGFPLEFADYYRHRGTIEWIHDFPCAIYSRAPENAVSVEVNLYLKGPGKAWFDDIYFGAAPTGDIAGIVTCNGEPVSGARVFIWATDYEDYTDENGGYTIRDVPVSAPRYLLNVTRDGYRATARGDIDVSDGGTVTVDLEMERGSNYPHQELRVKFGSLRHHDDTSIPTVPPDAVINPAVYPDKVRPYLLSGEYINSDHPLIRAAAMEILESLAPGDRADTRAVSYAIYLWVIKNYECDAIGPVGEFIDTTSGGWQTVSGEGWCWGHNFTDWLYKPSEMFVEHRGICIEHSRLVTSLLRSAGIPARPVKSYAAQFWAQPAGGEGHWVGLVTMGGRSSYRSTGNLSAGYESFSPSTVFNYPIDEGPIIHSDWYTESKCMWREVHPWEESYAGTNDGYEQAVTDLEIFARTGEAPDSPPPRSGPRHVLHYSDFTLNLTTIGEQRRLVARFPFPTENEHVDYLDRCAYWTDHPECVIRTWTEETANSTTGESAGWFNIEFDLTTLVTPETACQSGDYDGDGRPDIAVFRDTAGLWAVRGITRCYFGRAGDIPVSGDYDGDTTTEIGIFREKIGLWAIRGVTRLYYGNEGCRPVPADYDSDGSCAPSIFRPATGLWAVRDLTRTYFGSVTDIPVPADYDGSGTDNIAVFRAAAGLWAIRGGSRFYFGTSFDRPVPADYIGDGRSRPAIFRPASSLWAVRGWSRAYFGSSPDQAVPADYVGDRTDNFGIFRDDIGLWAIRSLTRIYFGGSGDIPATR